jgi:hypothetical protein
LAIATEPAETFVRGLSKRGTRNWLRQTGQKRKTGHEPNAGYCVFGRGMQRDDRVRSQGRVIRDAVEIEREFFVIANRNLNSSFLFRTHERQPMQSRRQSYLQCPLDLGEIEEDSYRFVRGSDIDYARKFCPFDRRGLRKGRVPGGRWSPKFHPPD